MMHPANQTCYRRKPCAPNYHHILSTVHPYHPGLYNRKLPDDTRMPRHNHIVEWHQTEDLKMITHANQNSW